MKKPKKLQNMSEQIQQHPKGRTQENSPRRPQAKLDDLDDEADLLAVSGRVKDDWKEPMKLPDMSELKRERSEQRDEEDSPRRPPDELVNPDDEAVI